VVKYENYNFQINLDLFLEITETVSLRVSDWDTLSCSIQQWKRYSLNIYFHFFKCFNLWLSKSIGWSNKWFDVLCLFFIVMIFMKLSMLWHSLAQLCKIRHSLCIILHNTFYNRLYWIESFCWEKKLWSYGYWLWLSLRLFKCNIISKIYIYL